MTPTKELAKFRAAGAPNGSAESDGHTRTVHRKIKQGLGLCLFSHNAGSLISDSFSVIVFFPLYHESRQRNVCDKINKY